MFKINLTYCLISFVLVGSNSFASSPKSFQLPSKAKIQIKGFKTDGNEADTKLCSDFRLNEAGLRNVFSTYRVITPKELHDYYDWLPCFIEGTITYQNKSYAFKARAGNILHTDYPDGVKRDLAGKRTTSP